MHYSEKALGLGVAFRCLLLYRIAMLGHLLLEFKVLRDPLALLEASLVAEEEAVKDIICLLVAGCERLPVDF